MTPRSPTGALLWPLLDSTQDDVWTAAIALSFVDAPCVQRTCQTSLALLEVQGEVWEEPSWQ